MRLVSVAGGRGTDYRIIDRIRDTADTTRDGVAFAKLSWQPSHCAATAPSVVRSLLRTWRTTSFLYLKETTDIDNLQPLCARCHAVKTVTERSAKG